MGRWIMENDNIVQIKECFSCSVRISGSGLVNGFSYLCPECGAIHVWKASTKTWEYWGIKKKNGGSHE